MRQKNSLRSTENAMVFLHRAEHQKKMKAFSSVKTGSTSLNFLYQKHWMNTFMLCTNLHSRIPTETEKMTHTGTVHLSKQMQQVKDSADALILSSVHSE